MAKRNKKYILKAAKDSIKLKFDNQLEDLNDRITELYNSEGHVDEADNLTHEIEDSEYCTVCKRVDDLKQQTRDIEEEWAEWKGRAKKNKKKVGKRVEWTNQREQAPTKTVNRDALEELRKTRKKNNRPSVGIAWLHEGALVIRRGQADMMIVTQIQGNSVECLKSGATQWFRNVSLRPAEWLMED